MKGYFFEFLRSVMQEGSLDSSKSFALVVSVLTGSIISLCVCFVMIYDVCSNGYLKTDLNDLGIFLLCIGGYVAGGGINKALTENIGNRKKRKSCSKKPTNTETDEKK